MDPSLHGWAGDHAGKVEGRQFYRALVSVSAENRWDAVPAAFSNKHELIGGGAYYPDIWATCLTPGAGMGWVTKCDHLGSLVYSLKLSQFDIGQEPWSPGVHLFSIEVGLGRQMVGTIATVIVPTEREKLVKLPSLGVQQMLTANRRGGGA